MVVDEQVTNQDGKTSDETPQTSQVAQAYSQDQVTKLMEKVRSDSLAELGRMRKATEEAIKKATSEARLATQQLLEQREREELESARDEPDKVAFIKERQVRRQKEDALAKTQEELNEAKVRLQEYTVKESETTRERNTRDVAERLKVDPGKLAKLAKFTDGSVEAIEDLANDLPKVSTTPVRNANLRPDSGDAAGGTAKTKYQIMDDYNKGKINAVQYADKMKAMGAQP